MFCRPRLNLIAYEYPPLIGGMATYARALARHMHQAGYEVHVFANEKAASEKDGIEVHPILTTDLARDLPRLARHRADLWHAINFGYAPLACVKRPFVLTVHGTDFLSPWVRWKMDRLPLVWRFSKTLNRPAWRRWLATPGLRCVDEILTCSHFSAQRFRQAYPVAGSVTVIPNGVDDFFLKPPSPARMARHTRRILTVCNLDIANQRKNVDGCLRAMALVGERLNLDYWIVGDGPGRAALQQLAERLGIQHRVSFKGRLTRSELRDAYVSASLLTLVPRPRPGDVEGFGIVYLEAAAAGTPSLAGRYGGAVDAVAEHVSGFFAEDAGPEAIAAAWTRYFTGEITFDERSIRAHARTFGWSTVLAQVERVYARHARVSPARSRLLLPHEDRTPTIVPALVSTGRPCDWSAWIRRPAKLPPVSGHGGRVLLIAYMFPPTGGSAVQRPAKLVKYLPECGWEVEVLTAAHDRFPWQDASLLNDLPDAALIHRVAGYEPANLARWLAEWLPTFRGLEAAPDARTEARPAEGRDASATGTDAPGTVNSDVHRPASRDARIMQALEAAILPDTGHDPGDRHGGRSSRWMEDRLYWRMTALTQKLGAAQGESLWIAPAVKAALQRHQRAPFDAVISTGPPHFVHHVAQRFAREARVPWLADLRDPLVSDFERAPRARRIQSRMRRLERSIARHADAVITTCPSLADDLRRRYPHRPRGSVLSITNGFDRDDLAPFADLPSAKHHSAVCTFIAAGAFYGRRELCRLIDPLERVLTRRAEWKGRVRFRLVGTLDRAQREHWQHHRPDWLELAGYLNHEQAVRSICGADCAVVVVPDCRHGRLSVPGKTFELMALPVHVLALVPPGSDAANLVADVGGVTTAAFEDGPAIEAALEQIIDATFNGRLSTTRQWSRVDAFDRRMIAHRFACALAAVTAQPEAVGRESDAEVPQGVDVEVEVA